MTKPIVCTAVVHSVSCRGARAVFWLPLLTWALRTHIGIPAEQLSAYRTEVHTLVWAEQTANVKLKLSNRFIGRSQMLTVFGRSCRGHHWDATSATLLPPFLIVPALWNGWYIPRHCICCAAAAVLHAASRQHVAFSWRGHRPRNSSARRLKFQCFALQAKLPNFFIQCECPWMQTDTVA